MLVDYYSKFAPTTSQPKLSYNLKYIHQISFFPCSTSYSMKYTLLSSLINRERRTFRNEFLILASTTQTHDHPYAYTKVPHMSQPFPSFPSSSPGAYRLWCMGSVFPATAYHTTCNMGSELPSTAGEQIPGWAIQVLGLRIPFYDACLVRSTLNMGKSPFDLNN